MNITFTKNVSFYLHLECRLPPSEANNEAPRPEIHRYSAAEAPCRLCLAPPATPPPPGASPPPRDPWHWQLPNATEFGLGQPIRQRHFSLKWRKESQPKPVGIKQSSPDGHRPQRPRAIVLLQVHLGLGLEKQLDHLRVAVACRWVQRGPASVRSPACGCASTPTKLGNKLLESMFVTRPF